MMWIVYGLAVWSVLALVGGIAIGRAAKIADEQELDEGVDRPVLRLVTAS